MTIWIMLVATAIEGRSYGKEQGKAQTGPEIDSEASRP
jgi:hypothetical protein